MLTRVYEPVGLVSQGLNVYELFPIELFNIADQALVRDLYLRFLCSNLTFSKLTDIGEGTAWVARFCLPCDSFLISSLKFMGESVKQMENRSKEEQIVESMNIVNITYVMLRKKIGYSSYKNESSGDNSTSDLHRMQIINLIKNIITNLPITKALIQTETNGSSKETI
jgi:hypothetical protein